MTSGPWMNFRKRPTRTWPIGVSPISHPTNRKTKVWAILQSHMTIISKDILLNGWRMKLSHLGERRSSRETVTSIGHLSMWENNYTNHSARGHNEFDSWESELTKHKSGIKDHVSKFVQVKHAYADMGLPFEHSRQGKVGFHDLDYPLLVEGEMGIILKPSLQVSDGEFVGRLLLLQKISQLQSVYEWPAVRDFYAAVLQRIERGIITWDRLDLASLELIMMSRAQFFVIPISCNIFHHILQSCDHKIPLSAADIFKNYPENHVWPRVYYQHCYLP